MFGKVRVMITDCPRFIVIFDNGKRTRLFPVVAGRASCEFECPAGAHVASCEYATV